MLIDTQIISIERPYKLSLDLTSSDLQDYLDNTEGTINEKGVHVEGSISKEEKNRFLLQFQLTADMTYPCSRCLKLTNYTCRYDYEEILEVNEETPTIDIRDYVVDVMYINEPMKVLCDEDCKGLCMHCGKNLNEDSCQCDKQNAIDPRFEKLKDLLNN